MNTSVTPNTFQINHGAKEERWVGFDLDDVLANMREPMCASMTRRVGKKFSVSDWTDYDYFDGHMSAKEFLQMLVDDRVLETCSPEPGAMASLQRLQAKGLKIAVITARGYHPRGEEVTLTWFAEQGVKIDSLQIVQPGQSKVEALAKLPNVIGYVDDHIKHLENISKANPGMSLHLMARPWNQHDKKFERVYTVSEYAEHSLTRAHALDATPKHTINRNRP